MVKRKEKSEKMTNSIPSHIKTNILTKLAFEKKKIQNTIIQTKGKF